MPEGGKPVCVQPGMPMPNDPLTCALARVSETINREFPDVAGAYSRFVARLKRVGAGHAAPAPGALAPDFALPGRDGALVTLDSLVAAGPLVLSFFRGGWCDYCATELDILAQHVPAIHAAGGTIAAVSGELGGESLPFRGETLPFPILSDADLGVAMAYGLLVSLDAEVQQLHQGWGIDFRAIYGNDSQFLAIPATFVLGRDRRVIAARADPDFRQRMPIGEILAAIAEGTAPVPPHAAGR
ncbi:peroxiredoxin-like family protein [Rhabdaerophilum sp. SD176]|uniref:peroxiredoxin-like family protein n=1 Tax=Rhabdaerophilum sp. SD176 TaxID=2983548 RepID=UPI0024DF5E07|nr:peroxiredoxin-like family protein [Rhabdaerophilum sp. SD176]